MSKRSFIDEIYLKFLFISTFLFFSGFQTWYYQTRWLYPYRST